MDFFLFNIKKNIIVKVGYKIEMLQCMRCNHLCVKLDKMQEHLNKERQCTDINDIEFDTPEDFLIASMRRHSVKPKSKFEHFNQHRTKHYYAKKYIQYLFENDIEKDAGKSYEELSRDFDDKLSRDIDIAHYLETGEEETEWDINERNIEKVFKIKRNIKRIKPSEDKTLFFDFYVDPEYGENVRDLVPTPEVTPELLRELEDAIKDVLEENEHLFKKKMYMVKGRLVMHYMHLIQMRDDFYYEANYVHNIRIRLHQFTGFQLNSKIKDKLLDVLTEIKNRCDEIELNVYTILYENAYKELKDLYFEIKKNPLYKDQAVYIEKTSGLDIETRYIYENDRSNTNPIFNLKDFYLDGTKTYTIKEEVKRMKEREQKRLLKLQRQEDLRQRNLQQQQQVQNHDILLEGQNDIQRMDND